MHRSLMSMQGLPVISETGVRLGSISDAYFEAFEQRIIAFMVDWENDLVRGPEDLLPLTQISELNADIVTVPDELGVSAGLEYDFQVYEDSLMPAFTGLIERPVEFTEGGSAGRLVDLHFDPQDGSVEAYEILPASDGEAPTLMLPPRPDFDFQKGMLVIPRGALQGLKPPREEEPESDEDLLGPDLAVDWVGEEDVEVVRSRSTQPD